MLAGAEFFEMNVKTLLLRIRDAVNGLNRLPESGIQGVFTAPERACGVISSYFNVRRCIGSPGCYQSQRAC